VPEGAPFFNTQDATFFINRSSTINYSKNSSAEWVEKRNFSSDESTKNHKNKLLLL